MLVDAEIEYDEDYMDIFVNACQIENQDNDAQLANITRFRNTYKEKSAVWWYTKESFLYSTVNKALRTQDVTTLFMMGFFIRDLHLQLIELQQTTTENQSFSILYRGQGMKDNDFQRIRQHIGGLISFNNFLSTTSDNNVSLMFARSARDDPLHMGILFRIQLQPAVVNNRDSKSPFASLRGVSYYPHEDEILFSMHTIFRIIDLHEIDERLWQIDLDLSNDQDEQLSVLLGQLRSEIYVAGVFNVDKAGQLCLKMGEYEGALDVYNTLLQLFPDHLAFLTYVHHHLGLTYQSMDKLDQAILHYEKAIDIRRSFANDENSDRYSIVAYANLSTIYAKKGDLVRARTNCERALALSSNSTNDGQFDPVLYCYHLSNLAFIQQAEGKFEDSLDSYRKVIALRLEHLPSNHPDLSVAYSNLATVYGLINDHSSATSCFHQALAIAEKSLPDNHETLGAIHFNIAVENENCEKYDEALRHFEKAVEIGQSSPSFNQAKHDRWIKAVEEIKDKISAK
jgi:tetratricopeptide (TPR) repeat protein